MMMPDISAMQKKQLDSIRLAVQHHDKQCTAWIPVDLKTYCEPYFVIDDKSWIKTAGEMLFELPDDLVTHSPNGYGQATYFYGSETPESLRMSGRTSVFMSPAC